MTQLQDERINRLWAIPMVIFNVGFFVAMLYYASLGSNIPDSYTSVMLTGFLGLIGFLMLLDVLSRRHWRWQSPTIIVGSFAALNCFMMLPLVNVLFGGYSVGFVLASLGVTVFLAVFFYVAFFTTPALTPAPNPASTDTKPSNVSLLSLSVIAV
jgi:uncharacterized membrane protein